jgi:Flp pilus assembly protein TadG
MALILPIIMLMLIGIIEFGRLLMIQQIITSAAREGGRIAVLPSADESEVRDKVTSVIHNGGLDVGKASIAVSGIRGGTGATTNVTVTYPFNSLLLTFIHSNLTTITVRASSSMLKE